MNHYERVGALLQRLARGPATPAELKAATGNPHDADLYRTRNRAAQIGFRTAQKGGIIRLDGGATLDAIENASQPTIAENIEARWGDGQNFVDDNLVDIEHYLPTVARASWRQGDDSVVYILPDDSMVGIAGDCWDVLTVETLEDVQVWMDGNGETWATLDMTGEPDGWQLRA